MAWSAKRWFIFRLRRRARRRRSYSPFMVTGHDAVLPRKVGGFHKLWPEADRRLIRRAIKTPGRLVDLEGNCRAGQGAGCRRSGGPRSKFLRRHAGTRRKHDYTDRRCWRIGSMGHSNGGGFVVSALGRRCGSVLAAIAPVCGGVNLRRSVKPRAAFHLGLARTDKLAKYDWQTRTQDHRGPAQAQLTAPTARPGHDEKWCTLYPSKSNSNPVITCIHPGGHELPEAAPGVRSSNFFREWGEEGEVDGDLHQTNKRCVPVSR